MIGRLEGAPETLRADVLVVGAGAAGLAVASELGRAGIDVLVVESGGPGSDGATGRLNEAEVTGMPHAGIEAGRVRGLGGTTRVWPGQLLRMRAVDFERRSWLPVSGWPVRAMELEGPYARAESFLGVPRMPLARDVWLESGLAEPPFDSGELDAVASSFMPKPDLGSRLRPELKRSERIRVLLDATALRLLLSRDERSVERVELGSPGGARAVAEARRVVLAAGGIENARLLLLSEVPNECIGRFFHDHPVAETAAIVHAGSPRRLQDWFGLFFRRGRRSHVKLALSGEAQARFRVPGCSATFVFRTPEHGATDALLRLRRRALRREPLRGAFPDVGRALADVGGLASTLQRRFVRGLGPAPRPAAIELLCIAEQVPDRDSRLALGAGRDLFGLPKARLDWVIGEPERAAIAATVDAVGRWLESCGLGSLEPVGWLEEDGWRAHLHDGFHHMGATRMSDDPDTGVVDRDCRVHGIDNLYVAGSSVFPTAGYANPTLTIVALAIRLADHLREAA